MDTTETLNGTYFYGGLSNLTPQQLWWAITIAVVSDHLGISAVDAALVISGQPVLPTRVNLVGQLQEHQLLLSTSVIG
ncbi:hypothetical protein JGS92_003039 [Salmonella enterica]|nr:hypothetical protein [Salmonella enterica subsp. enterica serovar Oranienburg]EEP9460173.1 hypothetical protein [Salmonella enterica]QQL65588.1 hypothetical protein HIX61_07260 [Salmonella enterica subsp. enterica serovar Othmarschen]EBV1144331.1 hypothetical protein [Salmonella enterica subsp. enterica serovar Oranienburg]EGW6330795.1 hypothetical protein [Salmonella enterica]